MQGRLLQASVSLALLGTPAYAGKTHFGFKQIIVAGSANVSAFALNNRSTIAGVYGDSTGGHGFIQAGSTLTVLPPPGAGCGGSSILPVPTAINAAGDVVGTADCGEAFGFLWRKGHYVRNGYVSLNYYGSVGINNKGEEFYDEYEGEGLYLAYAGQPDAFMRVTPNSTGYAFVSSLNNTGIIAGTTNQDPSIAFIEDQGVYSYYLPPGAYSSSSTFINDNGEIAGLYQPQLDHSYVSGFVYQAGQYTSYTLPGNAGVASIQAINNAGRVVGVFTNAAKNIQRAFLFNGTTLSVIGGFPPGDNIRIGLNDEGTMLISDYSPSLGTSATWRVLCGGDGC